LVTNYLSHIEDHLESLQNRKNTHLTALGVGLLAAAAVSLASNDVDLPFHGANAVRIAFRMGIHVQEVSNHLEVPQTAEDPKSWAYVIHGVGPKDAQRELNANQSSEPTSKTSKIFIGAARHTSVTISGPPSRLEVLFQKSKMFRDATSIPLPVYSGLCHAPHIYGPRDTATIVHHRATSPRLRLQTSRESHMPLHSTSTGVPYALGNAIELFENVITELLTQTVYWDNVIMEVINAAKHSAISKMHLRCFGNSVPFHDLEKSIQEQMETVKISIDSYMSSLEENTLKNTTRPRATAQAKLAIVGMACRFPGGATDTEKFWELLESGLDVSRQIPPDRFDIRTHYDADGKDMNKTMTQYGCFIDNPGLFDPAFFNMSPREAKAVDPQMRLSLVTAYEALERAGFVGNRTFSTKLQRIGTYYGQAADDYREVNQGQEVGTYYIPGGCRAFGPGRINYFFKFAGPSYSIDTACSSGLAAIEV
jgi:monodictyphenone polyketide synthase